MEGGEEEKKRGNVSYEQADEIQSTCSTRRVQLHLIVSPMNTNRYGKL